MKRICQIDGGGVRGLIPTTYLYHLLSHLHIEANRYFNFLSGSSVGAIISGCIAFNVPIQVIFELFHEKIPELFTPVTWRWFRNNKAKYNREPFKKVIHEIITKYSKSVKFGDATIPLMITSFNTSSSRTHFFKSWMDKDKNQSVVDIIANSALSAAYYFGAIRDEKAVWEEERPNGEIIDRSGAVWQDGGQATQNCTVESCILEAISRGWHEESEGVEILSLGTGSQDPYIPFEKIKSGVLNEGLEYPFQARRESTIEQIRTAKYIARWVLPNKIKFKRVDTIISKELDTLDGVEHMEEYLNIGVQLYNLFK